jgi:DNA-binding MarR family transcriptional regulator
MDIKSQYGNVREVLQLLVRRFGLLQKDSAQCCGVSVIHSHILYEVNRRPGMSLNELSEAISIDTSTLSRQVQQLVINGFIIRIPDPQDRRYVVLSLTPTGEEQCQAITKTMEEYIQSIFKNVPDDKRTLVLESLHILGDGMSKSPNYCRNTPQ